METKSILTGNDSLIMETKSILTGNGSLNMETKSILTGNGSQNMETKSILTGNDSLDMETLFRKRRNINQYHPVEWTCKKRRFSNFLKSDFRVQPKNVTAAIGDSVSFPCRPPRWEPDPRIIWTKKEKELITQDPSHTRFVVTDTCTLKQYAGFLRFLETNDAGERESAPDVLRVRDKPSLRRFPIDVTTREKKTAEFPCDVVRDKPLQVIRRKEHGNICGISTLSDHTLGIGDVSRHDSGIYVCAKSLFEKAEAVARLNVESKINQRYAAYDINNWSDAKQLMAKKKEKNSGILIRGNPGIGKTAIPRPIAIDRNEVTLKTNPCHSMKYYDPKLRKRLKCCGITSSISDDIDSKTVIRQDDQNVLDDRKGLRATILGQASAIWSINCEGKSRTIEYTSKKLYHEYFVTRGGFCVRLDDNKSDNSKLMTFCNCKETEHNQLYFMLFGKTMHKQRNNNGYVSEFKNITNEECMIRSNLLLDFQEIGDEAHHQRQFHPGMQDSCVKDNRYELFLHLDDKMKEFKKCFSNADFPRHENHILLEKVAKIKRYCDQLFVFVTMTNAMPYSEDQKLWLEMLTEDLLNTAYKRIFQLLATSDGNDRVCSELLAVVNDDDEVSGVSVKIGDGAFGGPYHFSKQQLIECQMCIDQNNALYWCNNCRMNICSFCKMYHETVWTVMNHEVYPLHLLS